MSYSINPFNTLQLQGNIAKVQEYSPNRAAFLTIAVKNGKDNEGNERTQFIQLKSFSPSCYNMLKVGMKVRVYGHIAPNKYEKDGQTIYSTDHVAEFIDFLESKATVEAREERKSQGALQA